MKPIDFEKVEGLLFDLDGTLVDSVPDLTSAIDTMMAELSLPLCGEANVRTWVGDGVDALICRALGHVTTKEQSDQIFSKARPIFFMAYQKNVCRYSKLYPGVAQGLKDIAALGIPMACVTNKPAVLAKPLMEALGIFEYFFVLVGGECVSKKKPAAEPLLMAANSLGIDIKDCIMIGDSANDVLAASSAGCPAVCVPYGYNFGADISQMAPDVIVEDIIELSDLLKKNNVSLAC